MTTVPNLANRLRPAGFSGRVWLVHGFNVSDRGLGTTDSMRSHYEAEGFEVHEFDTGWRGLSMVRFGNAKHARRLAQGIHEGDILVGHSDGCNIIDQAAWRLAGADSPRPLACIYYNPALDQDAPLAPQIKSTLIFHTQSDWIVKLAAWFKWHPWGKMGATGYVEHAQVATDPRYRNAAYEHLGLNNLGHSGVFKDPTYRERTFIRTELFLQSLI